MSDAYVLVTGGAGFIGSNVAFALARSGKRVIICDWMEMNDKYRNLEDIDVFDIVTPTRLPVFLERNEGKIQAVVHMGATSATTERDVDRLVENNVRLSLDLWEWCTRGGASFIYASSAAVYGDGTSGFDDDWSVRSLSELRPLNAYGWSKLFVDRRFSRDVAEGCDVPEHWVGLRFFNVYGPREEHKGSMRSVVSQVVPKILAGEKVPLFRSHDPNYQDGGQLRDFIHVDDCVAIILWLLEHREVNGIFNLGTGMARSFRDLVCVAFNALGREPSIEYIDAPVEIRSKYQYFTKARMHRLRDAGCQYEFMSLEKGVAAYAQEWVRRYGQAN